MKLPLSWLKKHLNTSASIEEVADMLTQIGHEVDSIEDTRKIFPDVVIGHVKERTQHPNADKLGVCMVDVGEDNLRQIICGAPNARAGLTVAVALPGAVLPGDFKIKPSKIRGVDSNGMICSARELGLGEDHSGIMELETTAPTGSRFDETLAGGDTIIELELTPNRGDCFNIYGLARDLAAAGLGTLNPLPAYTAGTVPLSISCASETPLCPFFSGIEIRNINNIESPKWLKEAIESIGLRPRNAVVDISNYVMYDLGQPVHTYDAAKVKTSLTAVIAKGGEKLHGIGERDLTLNAGDIAIADATGIVGLGGILGGESSAVSSATTHVYIEAAQFNRKQIALTGQAHQLHTDARQRNERGIDPAQTAFVARAAAHMIQEICGGEISSQQTVGTATPQQVDIIYTPTFLTTFGGLTLPVEEQKQKLTALGFKVAEEGDALRLTPPSWRTYMETPEDVVEEILRLIGYENIPSTLPTPMPHRQNIAAPGLMADRTTRRHLAAAGFTEVMTYSFINHQLAEQFANGATVQPLANPIDEDNMATLRPNLLPGLLKIAQNNAARSLPMTRIFEVGKVFSKGKETLAAAGIILPDTSRHWQGVNNTVTCFSAKNALYNLFEDLGLPADRLQISNNGAPSYLHPGRSADLVLGKMVMGTFGELHPTLAKQFDLKGPIAAFTLMLDGLEKFSGKTAPFNSSIYQPVERDLAFVVDATLPAGDLLNTVRTAVKDLATDVTLFDVYTGDKMPAGKKSLALSMTLQSDHTLTEDEITATVQRAVEACVKHYGAELRDA